MNYSDEFLNGNYYNLNTGQWVPRSSYQGNALMINNFLNPQGGNSGGYTVPNLGMQGSYDWSFDPATGMASVSKSCPPDLIRQNTIAKGGTVAGSKASGNGISVNQDSQGLAYAGPAPGTTNVGGLMGGGQVITDPYITYSKSGGNNQGSNVNTNGLATYNQNSLQGNPGGNQSSGPYQTLMSDWNAYFDTYTGKVGTSIPWAGGTLTMGEGGVALYQGPNGERAYLNRNTDPSTLLQYPGIAQAWQAYPGAFGTGSGYAGGGGGYPGSTSYPIITSAPIGPTGEWPPITATDAVMMGLGNAAGLMGAYQPSVYPDYVPTQGISPSRVDYPEYVANAPMASIQSPDYRSLPTDFYNNLQASAPLTAQPYKGLSDAAYNALKHAERINSPEYRGLMGGDYDALQKALATPGEIAAQQAYDQAYRSLVNDMSARGLYGSSIMQNQANEGLNRELINALSANSANAVAQRYGLQSQDLQSQNAFNQTNMQAQIAQNAEQNAFNLNRAQLQSNNLQNENAYNLSALQAMIGQNQDRDAFAMQRAQLQSQNLQNENAYNQAMTGLMMQQNQNLYNAGVTDAARLSDYMTNRANYVNDANEALRNWQNQQNYEQFQYRLAQGAYGNAQREAMINQWLALAGLGSPLSQAQAQYNLSQEAMDRSAWSQLFGGLINAGTTLGGAYLLSQ